MARRTRPVVARPYKGQCTLVAMESVSNLSSRRIVTNSRSMLRMPERFPSRGRYRSLAWEPRRSAPAPFVTRCAGAVSNVAVRSLRCWRTPWRLQSPVGCAGTICSETGHPTVSLGAQALRTGSLGHPLRRCRLERCSAVRCAAGLRLRVCRVPLATPGPSASRRSILPSRSSTGLSYRCARQPRP